MTNAFNKCTATGDEEETVYLFDKQKLKKLSCWEEVSAKLEVHNLYARPLELRDYERGYLELLTQLTEVGEVSESQYLDRFYQMKNSNKIEEHYVIVVIEDKSSKRVVGASTLFLELKFIHQCAIRGRLEDVAVLDTYRGRQIGELVVKIIVGLAREVYSCYKLSLDCKDSLKKFYAKNQFTYGSNMLAIRFDS